MAALEFCILLLLLLFQTSTLYVRVLKGYMACKGTQCRRGAVSRESSVTYHDFRIMYIIQVCAIMYIIPELE